VAGSAVLASGCTFHPGQAAVVNGSEISQGTVDDLVQAGCHYFEAQRKVDGSGVGPTKSVAYLRHLFTSNLISFELVDTAASDLHLTVSDAVVAKRSQAPALPTGMSQQDKDLLNQFFADSTRASLQQAVIGAHQADPSVTNADNVTPNTIAAGRAYVRNLAPSQAVTVNPAYGTWSHGRLLCTDGSLSAGQSAAA